MSKGTQLEEAITSPYMESNHPSLIDPISTVLVLNSNFTPGQAINPIGEGTADFELLSL